MINKQELPYKKAIIMIGYTHSGKTTLAKMIADTYTNCFVLDNDQIASFLRREVPSLFLAPENNTLDIEKPGLKLSIQLLLLDFGTKIAYQTPILSGCNLQKSFRSFLVKRLVNEGYKVGFIFLNLPIDIIKSRTHTSGKTTDCFRVAKSYIEVLDRQIGELNPPTLDEADRIFEIHSTDDIKSTLVHVQEWFFTA